MEATGMSDFIEMVNLETMIGKTLLDGTVIAEYKMDRCDNCEQVRRLDSGGYQRAIGGEPIMWFCVECRK